MANNKNRLSPFLMALCVVIGILIGTFYANHFSGNRLSIINSSSNKLNNLLHIINDQYVDTVDVNDLVEKAKAKATKPIEITTRLEVKNVLADEQYMTEAIANLIDNAIKYSKDEIKIEIKTFDTDKHVLLKVRDNGIGMTKEEQQVIFDKFGLAAIHEKNRKGGVSGFGLGLNYVDQVMQAHGGKVTVSSEKDKYSEFTLYIPKVTHQTH
jgi:two-component system phosphate regulon sensor histidine kinase PhoR